MEQVWRYKISSFGLTYPILDTSPSVIMMGAIERERQNTARECAEGLAGEYFKAMRDGGIQQAKYCLELKAIVQILGQ